MRSLARAACRSVGEVVGVDAEVVERARSSRAADCGRRSARSAARPASDSSTIGRPSTVATGGRSASPRSTRPAREPALHRLDAHARERLAIDPDGAPIERPILADRLEAPARSSEPSTRRVADQAIAVAVVEPQLQRQRQHLLRLQQRKRRTIGAPLRAVHRERPLLPLDAVAIDEVARSR